MSIFDGDDLQTVTLESDELPGPMNAKVGFYIEGRAVAVCRICPGTPKLTADTDEDAKRELIEHAASEHGTTRREVEE